VLSDDGQYIHVYAYEVINELYIFYASLAEPLKEGLTAKLEMISLTDIPAAYSVSGFTLLLLHYFIICLVCNI
jgi:hypothetical protein